MQQCWGSDVHEGWRVCRWKMLEGNCRLQRDDESSRESQSCFLVTVLAAIIHCIAVFSILADRSKNNLQSAQLLIGRGLVSGRMDGCRASVQHSCSRRYRPNWGDCIRERRQLKMWVKYGNLLDRSGTHG